MEKVGDCVWGLIPSPCTISQGGDRLGQGSNEKGKRRKVKDFREPKKRRLENSIVFLFVCLFYKEFRIFFQFL